MNTFAEAYKTGLEASKIAEKNLEEIDTVFEKLKTEILASSENKLLIERGAASRRKHLGVNLLPFRGEASRRYNQDMIDTIGALKQDVSYNAIIAKNTLTSSDVPIAEYTIDRREGYPVTIKWADRDESCLSKEALTATLKEVLSDPSIGRILETLLSTEATEETPETLD